MNDEIAIDENLVDVDRVVFVGEKFWIRLIRHDPESILVDDDQNFELLLLVERKRAKIFDMLDFGATSWIDDGTSATEFLSHKVQFEAECDEIFADLIRHRLVSFWRLRR